MKKKIILIWQVTILILHCSGAASGQNFQSGGYQGNTYGNILPLMPTSLTLQNIMVTPDQDKCYDATQVITVAGGETYFIVQAGGIAVMIAGQRISYLYGTRVFSGGFMSGRITTTGQYCSSLKNGLVAAEAVEPEEATDTAKQVMTGLFRVFPNPTEGVFTVEWTRSEEATDASVSVYTFLGERLRMQREPVTHEWQFSLEGLPPGIYLVYGKCGTQAGTVKVVKVN